MFESGSICQGQDSHSNAESAGQSTMFPFEIEGRDVPDVAEEIFSHLDDKTLFKFRVVSKRWKEVIDKILFRQTNIEYGNVAYWDAAQEGRVDICKLYVKNLQKDKNPSLLCSGNLSSRC